MQNWKEGKGSPTVTNARRMLTIKQVLEIVPTTRRNILRMEKEGRFPAGVFLSPNRKAWYEDQILEWQASLPSDKPPPRKPPKRKRVAVTCGAT